MTKQQKKLIWIDLEMTGLIPEIDRIIEMATVITNSELDILAEGPEIVIWQSDLILAGMDSWNTKHHKKSGLIKRIKKSSITESQAQLETISFIQKHVKKNESPICGNSVCQDRRFLARWMPDLEAYFHYRHLDVSSLKILAEYWAPNILKTLRKESRHRAKDDILESIGELKHYREKFITTENKI